jgi:hypothetical protein
MNWFDFSIIKYMPNVKRGEIINLGLVIYGPNGLDFKFLDSYSKARMLDGVTNELSLTNLNSHLRELLIEEDLNSGIELINTLQKSIYLTKPSSFQLSPFETYNQKVQKLYNDLIKPYTLIETRPRKTHCRLMSDIKRKLSRQSLLSNNIDDLHKHKIIPSFVLNETSGLTADFMLKNGVYHMSSVVDFNVNDIASKFKETGLKVLSFHEGEKRVSDSIKKYFVYSAEPKKENDIAAHLGLVDGNCDLMFNMNSADDSTKYYDLMVELTNTDGFKF